MKETTLLGVNILLLVIVWRCVLRKTALDHCRDALFDLREATRDFFKTSTGLEDTTYKNIRNLLNNYIRFTEDATFTRTFGFASKISENPELLKHLIDEMNSKFASSDPSVQKFVTEIRHQAVHVVQIWIFHSSFYSCGLYYLVGAYCIIEAKCDRLRIKERISALLDGRISGGTLELLPNTLSHTAPC